MSFSNPTAPVSPEMRERLFLVTAGDLASLTLRHTPLHGRLSPLSPRFCDVWSAAIMNGVLYGDFCVELKHTPHEARFAALRRLIGDVSGVPNSATLLTAMRRPPQTLLIAMWGQDVRGSAFAALYHHPSFSKEEALLWLLAWMGRGSNQERSEA